mmetsp:Transcript_12514/g.19691  ORF Transcript_12514/g.19691 Transcript_12514/m.19691 type:complete len:106 (+) Transcript_12514:654-971(+)
MPSENHDAIPIYSFSLVLCRHPDGRYLLVQEFCNQGFWLPGGAVDPGESLQGAAIRETKEEAGIDIMLTGILKIERSSRQGSGPKLWPTRPRATWQRLFVLTSPI